MVRKKRSLFTNFAKLSWYRKILYTVASLSLLVTMVLAMLIVLVSWGWFGPVPKEVELKAIEHPVASSLYSADSVLLARFYIQNRSSITFEQLPKHLIDALVSTEDERFYQHGGIDYQSLLRVVVKSILLGDESAGGGSTITQQLAKNLYPRQDYFVLSLLINKIRESIIATRIESIYSKDAILLLYLNTVPFGDNAFGIEAASNRFYSKPTRKLTVEESATLIGMLKATYTYNPRIFPDRSLDRRNVVLSQMVRNEYLSGSHYDSLSAIPLNLQYQPSRVHDGLAPYFTSFVRNELDTWCKNHRKSDGTPYNLYTDGLQIYCTIHAGLQEQAENAMKRQMSELQKAFSDEWGAQGAWNDMTLVRQQLTQSVAYKRLSKEGLSEEEIWKQLNTPIPMTVFDWRGEREVVMSPIDSMKHYLKHLNAGMLAMDPQDGDILIWVGGINHKYFQFDHVRESTKRQVGSTFKPIVFAAALGKGVKPCEYVSAEKVIYSNMDDWEPGNAESNYDKKYSMGGALAHSVNTVAIKLIEEAGIDQTIDLARRLGITSDLPAVPSVALGTASISAMEMTTAYSSFVNEGFRVTPRYLTAIRDAEGKVLEDFESEVPQQVMDPITARLILEMLRGVVDKGTAAQLRSTYHIQGDLGGKTGTTQSNADGWYIAVMPTMIVTSWVGADNPSIRFKTTSLGQGARSALPMFARLYMGMNQSPSLRKFTTPTFPPLSAKTKRQLDCADFKSDKNAIQRLFKTKKEDEVKRKEYGKMEEKKKGFWKRLLGE